jgi:glycosyltransferase, SP_1767 family
MGIPKIKVLSNQQTLDFILKHGSSVARFGDGEVELMTGKSIPYQSYDKDLAAELKATLQEPSSNELLVCLPDVFEHLERYNSNAKKFWKIHFDQAADFYKENCQSEWYGSTFLSRPYIDLQDKSQAAPYFERLKTLWKDCDILIVEGETSRSGMGNDLFAQAKSVSRIIGPSKNAYIYKDELLREIKKYADGKLILLMLGPTAKVLVKELAKDYQAIDLGHIDSEYEWFKQQATHKVKLAHKHTAEHNKDDNILPIEDEQYLSEIVARVGVNQTDFSEKISVIVPIYNAEKYLHRCIDSILKQTYSDLEVILINDGSTDGSAAILETYKDSDARLRIVHKENEGVSATRNFGLQLARGRYVSFIDSDDFIDESYFKTLHNSIIEQKSDIAICNFTSYSEERHSYLIFVTKDDYFEKNYSPEEWLQQENNPRQNLFLTVLFPVTKLYKRELWDGIEFPVGKVREDDATIYKLYLRAKKISFTNVGTYFYSQRPDSLSHTVMLDDIESMITNSEERLALLAALGYDLTEHIDSYTKRLEKCQTDALNAGQIALYKRIKVKLDLIKQREK